MCVCALIKCKAYSDRRGLLIMIFYQETDTLPMYLKAAEIENVYRPSADLLSGWPFNFWT